MNAEIRRHVRARHDLVDIFTYIGRDSRPSARRFLQQAEATFQRLSTMPLLGKRYDPDSARLGEPRYFPVARFKKYLVFYRPRTDGVEVLRVLHGARDLDVLLADDVGELDVP